MNFFLAALAWIVIGVLLGIGIWLFAVKGIAWVLGLITLCLFVAVWKIGCTAH